MAKKQAVNGERGRWSAKAKREAVLRLLRGEGIDALSRELKVTAAEAQRVARGVPGRW